MGRVACKQIVPKDERRLFEEGKGGNLTNQSGHHYLH